MSYDHQLNFVTTKEQKDEIERVREDMQKSVLGHWSNNGDAASDLVPVPTKITRSDAIRHMIASDRRHEARLVHVDGYALVTDIGRALEALDYDADARTQVLAGVQAAHAHLQDQLSEELDVTVSKI